MRRRDRRRAAAERAAHAGRRDAGRRPGRLAGRPVRAGHRGRPALPDVPAGRRPGAALPAARRGPARPVRRAGPGAAFLAAYRRFTCIPGAEELFAAARPAGPCAFYPMNDTWTDQPYAPGVVLIGDAAGWNDPIIGQGLSIALRDVRMVSDILGAGPRWSTTVFAPYAAERRERMRRLRVARRRRHRSGGDVQPGRRGPPARLQRGLPPGSGARRAAPGAAARPGQRARRGVRAGQRGADPGHVLSVRSSARAGPGRPCERGRGAAGCAG